MPVNQALLQWMTLERIADAQSLLASGRWSFAYYVAGYAVECALKSCVLSRTVHTGAVFTDRKFAEKCFTHDLEALVTLAGLRAEWDARSAASYAGGQFARFWTVVAQWKETSRYQPKTEGEAKDLFEAITHDPHGVLKWIQNYW